ncbi:hypothetical protein NC796_22535 [Aliifodinibius sp. S!AR15-10]|uniref:hypothetical protein n=1 Tax=Aliifodinibius sp. S!AR15-10 TaxID=2950437 RepID=UPI002863BF48|nr:hypothetical protein [Aliifodinibius sp. S!AR15-10]MDR8393949.1 hypothetical protein [Aliifodinibius sp. S!AR15-10]
MNTPDTQSRLPSFYLLAFLIFFQAISGLLGGAMLVLDPTGSMLHMPLTLLEDSPFNSYLVPGLILFFVLGVAPLVVFYGLFRSATWAWPGAVLVSMALIAWIGVEIAMIGYQSDPPLQLIYGLVGIVLLILTQWPAVREKFKSNSLLSDDLG